MNSSDFKKLANKHLAPNIRQLGWKGSGFHFYQLNENHVVNIFGIQGSWYGGSVCCETAIHFDFLHDFTNKLIDATKTTYASCIIRKRLTPKGIGDHHWTFRENDEENIKSLSQIWEAFKTHGLTFYNDFRNFPHPFDKIEPKALRENNNYQILNKYYVANQIHLAWLLKEINVFIGRHEKAKEFAEYGMTEALKNAEHLSMIHKNKTVQSETAKNYIETNKELFKV